MQRAETTKTNDAVTLRQFHRFLESAKLPHKLLRSWVFSYNTFQVRFLNTNAYLL